uniref:Uncharacterized protein n=1 Tax=Romanomermis culicivorax TaxID=13658 RepID=A0A915L8N7_ROMCU
MIFQKPLQYSNKIHLECRLQPRPNNQVEYELIGDDETVIDRNTDGFFMVKRPQGKKFRSFKCKVTLNPGHYMISSKSYADFHQNTCYWSNLRSMDVFFLFDDSVQKEAVSGVYCRNSSLIESYGKIAESLPTDNDMYETIGRIVVLIAGPKSPLLTIPMHNLNQITKYHNSTQELAFQPLALNGSPFTDDDARNLSIRIGQKVFGRCFDQVKEEMKPDLKIDSVQLTSKDHYQFTFGCKMPYRLINPKIPISYEVFDNGVSILNTINATFSIELFDQQTLNLTCRAHFMYGFAISRIMILTLISGRKIGENIILDCDRAGGKTAGVYWTFNGERVSKDLIDSKGAYRIR